MTTCTKSKWKPPRIKCMTRTSLPPYFAGVTLAFRFENGICLSLLLLLLLLLATLRSAGSPGYGRHLLNAVSRYMWETSHMQKSSPCLALSSGQCWKWWTAGSVSMEIPLGQHWRNGWISSRYGSPNKHKQTREVALIAWHRHWDVIPGKLHVLGNGGGGSYRCIQKNVQGMKS